MLAVIQYVSLLWKRDDISLKKAIIPFALFGLFADLIGLVPISDGVQYTVFNGMLKPIVMLPVMTISAAVAYFLFKEHIYKHHKRPRITLIAFLLLVVIANWIGFVIGMAIDVFGEVLPNKIAFLADLYGMMVGTTPADYFFQQYGLFIQFHVVMGILLIMPEYFVADALEGSPLARSYDWARKRLFPSLPSSKEISDRIEVGGQKAWRHFVIFMALKHKKTNS